MLSSAQDWWNSFSYAAYYRMWNVVVHDWLFAYIYKDTLLIFGDDKKAIASVLVFALSAVAHEYILILAFGFFFPLLFFMFGGVGCKCSHFSRLVTGGLSFEI